MHCNKMYGRRDALMTVLSNQEKWQPWQAFALEAVTLVLLVTAGSAMQASWGWTGLVLTELLFLALAVGTALLHRTPLREVFPMSVPTLRELGGVVVLAVAGMLLSMVFVGVALMLFPQSFGEVAGLEEFLYGGEQSLLVAVLVIALLPAICEEALHRGAILSHLRSLRSDWLIVLIMGAFFGLFHLNFSRFLSTATLGVLFSYLMVKRNNIVLPMLMHFLNNLISTLIGFGGVGGDTTQAMDALQSISTLQIFGSYLVIGCLAPVLLALAMRLVDPEGHTGRRWLIGGLCSVAMFVGGIVCVASTL